MKFTDRGTYALKATGNRFEKSETNGRGLLVRIGRTGAKTFVCVYGQNGVFRCVIVADYTKSRNHVCTIKDGLGFE